MKRNLLIFILAFLMIPLFSAQKLDRKYRVQYQRLYSRLKPAAKSQLARMVKQFENQMIPLDHEQDPKSSLDRIFSAAGLGNMSVMDAAFAIMMKATKDMDDDIRMIMAEIKAMTVAKQKLREFIKNLNQWISREMAKHPDSEDIGNQPVSPTGPGNKRKMFGARKLYTPNYKVPFYKTSVVKPIPRLNRLPIRQLRRLLILNKNKLKIMAGLLEEISLKLKMMMDRRAKLLQTLAGAMKRISNTQKQLKDNLK